MKQTKKKTKQKHIHTEKKVNPGVPAEWLYLNPEEVSLRQLYGIFDGGQTPFKAELWEEAGVLEITVPQAGSVDMEAMECSLGDETGDAFVNEHGIRTAFAVTIVPEEYEKARQVMDMILEKTGGFFCGDTETLQPVIEKIQA